MSGVHAREPGASRAGRKRLDQPEDAVPPDSHPPADPSADPPDAARPAAGGRASWLLLVGAALGLGLATVGILETPPGDGLPDDAIARVGSRTIRTIDFQRVLAGVETDRRGPIDDDVRRRVLERMIDEELLVQRALDLGLASVDRRIRGELTTALMDSIVAEADAEGVTEAELRAHFEANVDFFSRPGRLHGRTIFFAEGAGRARASDAGDPIRRTPAERAARALERLRAGEATADVAAELGDPQISALPDGLLPPAKVRDYVGPTVLQALESLEAGAWSEPIAKGRGLVVAGLVAREAPVVPDFEEVREFVRQDLRRRRGDQALRDYLDELRADTPIAIDEAVLLGGGD